MDGSSVLNVKSPSKTRAVLKAALRPDFNAWLNTARGEDGDRQDCFGYWPALNTSASGTNSDAP